MKKVILLFVAIIAAIGVFAQNKAPRVYGDVNGDGIVDGIDVNDIINLVLGKTHPPLETQTFTVNGVSFNMVPVQGGTFTMGQTVSQTRSLGSWPPHLVTLSSFTIGETEVSQLLWYVVMGSNPSHYAPSWGYSNNLQRPVDAVSWNMCQEFITKLNQMTGQNFRLPTEAEWEYAARGGKNSHDYSYSGSNNIEDVAWYDVNANNETHTIATKAPNELGLYDMSGNVYEYCIDYYEDYSSSDQINPSGPIFGSLRIARGGGLAGIGVCDSTKCLVSTRGFAVDPSYRVIGYGLRLVRVPSEFSDFNSDLNGDVNGDGLVDGLDINDVINIVLGKSVSQTQAFTVNGVSFNMIPVEGGSFTMGATPEQGAFVWKNEKPTHQVTVSSFSIGQTEVTQDLWQAVMGSNPSYFNEYGNSDAGDWSYHGDMNYGTNLQRPVECVSWEDCQEFITKLNQMTGQNFRLPTEAEWEYAARGGRMRRGYMYSGSNTIDDVAWYNNVGSNFGPDNPNYGTHPVATKAPNELNLYDMTGNVSEWCQDWYGLYSNEAQINPLGPTTGDRHVYREGNWEGIFKENHVSCRSQGRSKSKNIGLRLAY